MCKIPYEKCVCFIFLVILAILSCSGFRIDNLAMTDISKKNFHTSSSVSNIDRIFNVDSVQRPHRIRHHRLWRSQAHNRHIKPHIDAIIIPPSEVTFPPNEVKFPYTDDIIPSGATTALSMEISIPTALNFFPTYDNVPPKEDISLLSRITLPSRGSKFTSTLEEMSNKEIFPSSTDSFPNRDVKFPNFDIDSTAKFTSAGSTNYANFPSTLHPYENNAQIPSTDSHQNLLPTTSIISRSQRSPGHKHRPKQNKDKWQSRQEDDLSLKAYKAEIVILVEPSSCNSVCDCYMTQKKSYKNKKIPIHIRRISMKIKCDQNGKRNQSKNQVTVTKFNQKYVVFLNASSASNYKTVNDPLLVKSEKKLKRIERILKRASSEKLVPTSPKIDDLKVVSAKPTDKRRKLLCQVRGFPVPNIHWRWKGEKLRQNSNVRIQYRRKKSRLIIKKLDAESLGHYECVAEGADGRTVSRAISSESFSSGKECKEPHKTNFCYNGGICQEEPSMTEIYCICPTGYTGQQCDNKVPSNTSMYPQPDIFSCKLGLSTKYYC